MTPNQRIRWCTPQCILDVANGISWNSIPAATYDDLAAGLDTLVRKENLPPIIHAPACPASPPALDVAPDVPQAILNVFNGIDWTQVAKPRQQKLAKRLSSFISGPIGQMMFRFPIRRWHK